MYNACLAPVPASQDTDASNMPTIVGSAVGVGLFATLLLLMLGVGVVVAKKRFSQSKYEDQEELHNGESERCIIIMQVTPISITVHYE